MAQSSSQLVSLSAGAQFPSARYLDWLQVQAVLDMAESALRAKNAANDVGVPYELLVVGCSAVTWIDLDRSY